MLNKKQRNYIFTVRANRKGKNGENIEYVFAPPLDCDIRLSKATLLGGYNSLTIIIYNLGEDARNDLYQNMFGYTKKPQYCSFQAGYGDSLALMYDGVVRECYTELQGTRTATIFNCVNIIKNLKDTQISKTIIEDNLYNIIVNVINENFKDYRLNIEENTAKQLKEKVIHKPMIIFNNVYDFLIEYNVPFYIDGSVINIIDEQYTYEGLSPITISSETGLLKTPKFKGNIIECDVEFEPYAILGRKAKLNSTVMPQFNNDDYKIVGIDHIGGFGATTRSNLITHLQLQNQTLINQQGKIYE